jgi:hypothetical protein
MSLGRLARTAWRLFSLTVRFVAAGIIAWEGVRAAERGGPWIALACPLALIGLGVFVLTGLGAYGLWQEFRAKGHV